MSADGVMKYLTLTYGELIDVLWTLWLCLFLLKKSPGLRSFAANAPLVLLVYQYFVGLAL